MKSFWARSVAGTVVIAAALAAPGLALAQWSSPGSGPSAGAAATMPAGNAPAGSATGSSVSVRWTAATFASGSPVGGYVISRFDAVNGSQATVGPGCSGVVTSTTCTELSVPSGTWVYTDTPVQASWTGSASSPSGAVTVP